MEDLINHMSQFITEHKLELFDKILEERTRHLSVMVENIYQPHNASAVLRTCDCFGVQDVHIVENTNKYEVNPQVALGASKWLTIHKYSGKENNTVDCISQLKGQGYKVYATTPHTDDVNIDELDVTQKTVLMFGTEGDGLSKEAMANADGFVKIPMYGFTESFNISVSAALCLRDFTERMRRNGVKYQLTEDEKQALKLDWIKKVVKKSELIEREFLAKYKQ